MDEPRTRSAADAGGMAGAATDPALPARWRRPPPPGEATTCAVCDVPLTDRVGWCSGCRLAFCFACGRRHFCRPGCSASGCIAGLCVREVRDGVVSERWGLPPD